MVVGGMLLGVDEVCCFLCVAAFLLLRFRWREAVLLDGGNLRLMILLSFSRILSVFSVFE